MTSSLLPIDFVEMISSTFLLLKSQEQSIQELYMQIGILHLKSTAGMQEG